MSLKLVSRSILNNTGNRGQMVPRLANAVRWQLSKRLFSKRREITLANGAKFLAHPDCVVSSSLIYADWPEFEEFQFIRSHLNRNHIVLDVGANVGHVSLLLSDIVGDRNIYAFEPTPVTYRRLTRNWQLNGWETDQLFSVALGSEDGTTEIPDVTHPDTMNSVAHRHGTQTPLVAIPMSPLDSFRDRWKGRRIGLLKIDVEGFEDQVFAGAKNTLKEDRPELLMFESLDGAPDEAIVSVLTAADYQIFQLDDSGCPDPERQDSQNLFAVPAELSSSLFNS